MLALLKLYFFHIYNAFILRQPKRVIAHQYRLLLKMIKANQNTEYGKKHHFDKIKTYVDFANQIPINDYETLFPFIQQMMKGKENVLTSLSTNNFAKSSGTVNASSKFIPITKQSILQNHFKGGFSMLSIFVKNFPQKNIFKHKNVSIAGTYRYNKQTKLIGDLSSILMLHLPKWVQKHRLPPKEMALMADWDKKLDKISSILLNEDVGSLTGLPSWNYLMLQQLVKKAKQKTVKAVWPNFQLFVHGGVDFSPYHKRFKNLIGKDVVLMNVYNASEGFFAIQDQFNNNSKDMLLLCNHGVFYEFVEVKNKDKICTLAEVKLNCNYILLVTTWSGLWRYKIGDTVEFTSLHPFRIRLTGREKYFINLVSEELIEDNVNIALSKTCNLLNCSINEFTIGPIYPDKNGVAAHEYFIEFDIAPQELKQFAKTLDEQICLLNTDYATQRNGHLCLSQPVIHAVKKGTFYRWLSKNKKLGGQNKVPRLLNHRKVIDEIKALQNSI